MAYIEPATVTSPKNSVKNVRILCNTGAGGFAVAELEWDGAPALGIRWNGEPQSEGVGTPQSRGNPTWFILPNELRNEIEQTVRSLAVETNRRLLEGYRAMAADGEREREAEEWIEGLENND